MNEILRGQVCIVSGEYSAALYDFDRGSIRRISHELADRLKKKFIDLDKEVELPGEIVESLRKFGYLRSVISDYGTSYVPQWRFSKSPQLRALVFNASLLSSDSRIEQAEKLIVQAHTKYDLLTCLIIVNDDSCAAALNLLKRITSKTKYLLIELEMSGVVRGSSESYVANVSTMSRVRFVRIPEIGSPVVAKSIVCNYFSFSLLRNRSESAGIIRIDADGSMYPGVQESFFRIGRIKNFDLDDLQAALLSDDAKTYWNLSKDERDICRGCELRYACTNSLANRVDLRAIESAPANCSYDQVKGIWQRASC